MIVYLIQYITGWWPAVYGAAGRVWIFIAALKYFQWRCIPGWKQIME